MVLALLKDHCCWLIQSYCGRKAGTHEHLSRNRHANLLSQFSYVIPNQLGEAPTEVAREVMMVPTHPSDTRIINNQRRPQ